MCSGSQLPSRAVIWAVTGVGKQVHGDTEVGKQGLESRFMGTSLDPRAGTGEGGLRSGWGREALSVRSFRSPAWLL